MLNIPKLIREVDEFCEEFGVVPATVANQALDYTNGLNTLVRAGEKIEAKARRIRSYMAARRRAAAKMGMGGAPNKLTIGKQSVSAPGQAARDDQARG